MTLRSLACLARRVATTLAVVGAVAPHQARGQEPEGQCRFREGSRSLNSIMLAGGGRITYLGTPNIACNDGVRITADSAVAYSAQNMTYLMGNVRFRDATREMRSDEARYFSRQGRLQAQGHLFVRDTVQGSVIENGNLVYLRQTSFRDQEEMTVTTGNDGVRPTALLYMRAAADTTAADSVAQDTTAAPTDTAAVPTDTAAVPQDTAAVPTDTAAAPQDTTRVLADTVAPAVRDSLAAPRDTVPTPARDTLPPPSDTVPPPLRDTLMAPRDTAPPARDTTAQPPDTGAVRVRVPVDSTHVPILDVPPLPDSLRQPRDTAAPRPPGEALDTAGPPPLRHEARAEPAPADTIPYEVEANRIFLAGDQYFRSSGNVVIHRDSLTAHADSAEYDQVAGRMLLQGSARVESSGYDLSGRTVNLAVPAGQVRTVTATHEAKLLGQDLTLTAPVIRVFLTDGSMERLVAVFLRGDDAEAAAEGPAGGPRSAAPEGAEPDTAAPAQPVAVARQFRLSADSLDVLAPGQQLDRIFAAGNARGQSNSRDSLNVEVLPPVARSDWLAGDTVIATFEKVEPAAGAPTDTAQYRLDRLEAVGDARTLYRLAPSDSTFRPGVDIPAVHYTTGSRIVMVMSQGEVDSMEVQGPTHGWHMEPQRRSPAQDTLPPDTSAVVGPDTAQAALEREEGPGRPGGPPAGTDPGGAAGSGPVVPGTSRSWTWTEERKVTTRDELKAFLDGLASHDLSVAVGLCELVHRADDAGAAERGVWIASVRDELEALARQLGSHGASMLGSEGEALAHFLETRVIVPLEDAGVARRDDSGDAWSSLVVDPALWRGIAGDRAAVLAELQASVSRLEEERGRAFMLEGSAEIPGESRLYAEGLTKIYRRRRVVSEVDIAVRQGQIVGLLGPNGAGKTTTFYMMVGLIPPNEGRVFLDGDDITSVPMYKRARKGVGYLAQEPSIFRKLTVEENVLAILETLKLGRKEEKERLEQLLRELGLQGLRNSKAYSLSGGERRRLEITRALVQRPKFMLLDEPFAGIDPIAVNDIQQIVRGLKSRGIGVIISDHNVEQTLEIVDRAYIMYEGRIRVSGTVSELVWNEEVAEIYLGPTLTQRMRGRYARPQLQETTASSGA